MLGKILRNLTLIHTREQIPTITSKKWKSCMNTRRSQFKDVVESQQKTQLCGKMLRNIGGHHIHIETSHIIPTKPPKRERYIQALRWRPRDDYILTNNFIMLQSVAGNRPQTHPYSHTCVNTDNNTEVGNAE